MRGSWPTTTVHKHSTLASTSSPVLPRRWLSLAGTTYSDTETMHGITAVDLLLK